MNRIDQEHEAVSSLRMSMLRKLRKNAHKPSWRYDTPKNLLVQLIEEVEELEEALRTGSFQDILDECADVANFAAMIHDNVKRSMNGQE